MVDTKNIAHAFTAKVALLVANGFTEAHMTELQRALTRNAVPYAVIAPEQGLVNSWQGQGWGHHFTVDVDLARALGSDYEALIIPGGTRSLNKLRDNPHARRVIKHFFDAEKPILLIEEGIVLAALASPAMQNFTVADVDALRAENALTLTTHAQDVVRDGILITATSAGVARLIADGLVLIAEHCAALNAELSQETPQESAAPMHQAAA